MSAELDDDAELEGQSDGGKITRRQFLGRAALASAACALGPALQLIPQIAPQATRLHRALYWKPLANKRVKCLLCPKHCTVGDRERGYCGVRENRGGVYYTLVYGQAASAHPYDPIEKKPLFHFLPGTRTFSIATAGCNMDCKDCQNWQLSQSRPEQVRSQWLPPERVAALAAASGCKTIAYTYNEPVIFYEYMLDCAKQGRKHGVGSVMITNGYINREPMLNLLPHLSAVKIDLKGFTDKFYRTYCNGTLQPVLDCIKLVHSKGKWLEIVYLVVPGINHDPALIRRMSQWLVQNVGPDVPLHFTRFYPHYQLKHLPPTPVKTLEMCRDIARKAGLRFVYIGNVPGHRYENTYCPGCGRVLIERFGFQIRQMNIRHGRCRFCGRRIPGVWGS